MIINDEGLKLIKESEGLKLKAYQDQGGVWTIGYGTTEGVKAGMEITEEKATELLMNRLSEIRKNVEGIVKIPLNQNQLGAVLSLCYNIGFHAFCSSQILRFINQKETLLAANQFIAWNKVAGQFNRGLYDRRMRERELFLKPI